MRAGVCVLLGLILTALGARGDENLPVLKVGSEVYSNVTVTEVTATDIYFSSDQGLASAKLMNLEPEMQRHFNYDAERAAEVERERRAPPSKGPAGGAGTAPPHIDRGNAKAIMDDTIARVKQIVNQPVTKLARTADMEVSVYSPGWFHPGAERPDFKTVDVRKTRQSIYDGHPYVSSDLNPGVAFRGPELEFNSMTKYFYGDRSLPKKKLTEAEMQEINRLYRIIATCEDKLKEPGSPQTSMAPVPEAPPPATPEPPRENPPVFSLAFLSVHRAAFVVIALTLMLLMLFNRYLTNKPYE
jgi:hypothetical protein